MFFLSKSRAQFLLGLDILVIHFTTLCALTMYQSNLLSLQELSNPIYSKDLLSFPLPPSPRQTLTLPLFQSILTMSSPLPSLTSCVSFLSTGQILTNLRP